MAWLAGARPEVPGRRRTPSRWMRELCQPGSSAPPPRRTRDRSAAGGARRGAPLRHGPEAGDVRCCYSGGSTEKRWGCAAGGPHFRGHGRRASSVLGHEPGVRRGWPSTAQCTGAVPEPLRDLALLARSLRFSPVAWSACPGGLCHRHLQRLRPLVAPSAGGLRRPLPARHGLLRPVFAATFGGGFGRARDRRRRAPLPVRGAARDAAGCTSV